MMADVGKKEIHTTTNPDCLICSGRIKVSKRNCFNIFGKHVTEASGSPLHAVISRVLEVEIREKTVHSNVICKLCLKMLNEVDDMQVKIQELKDKLSASYQESVRLLNKVNIDLPEECNIDRKVPLELLATTAERSIKLELCNRNNKTTNGLQQESVEQEESVDAEESESEIDETSANGVPDTQETAAANGEYSDDAEEMCDPDYVPNPVIDTDMKPVMTQHKKPTFKKTKKAKGSMLEKLVERDGAYFVCSLCKDHKIMGDRKGIVCHLKDIHNIRVYICEICLQYFQKRSDLSEHLDNHVAMEEGEFHCEVCDKDFHNVRLFEVHRRIHFPQTKTWPCETCDKSFASRNMLEEHINTHIGLRPYICEECGKGFASKYTHQAHKKIHENRERNFACDQCDKAFYRATSLKQHERTHNGLPSYVCEQCGKAFITARYLEVHSIIHTGYRPFVCGECGKGFVRRAEMVNHERTHTGEKPYQCEFCGATFSQRSNLQSHKRATHYQDKRYECEICDKKFKRKRLLDYHVRAVHTGERPYNCKICSASFIYPHHFKKHNRLHVEKV